MATMKAVGDGNVRAASGPGSLVFVPCRLMAKTGGSNASRLVMRGCSSNVGENEIGGIVGPSAKVLPDRGAQRELAGSIDPMLT